MILLCVFNFSKTRDILENDKIHIDVSKMSVYRCVIYTEPTISNRKICHYKIL